METRSTLDDFFRSFIHLFKNSAQPWLVRAQYKIADRIKVVKSYDQRAVNHLHVTRGRHSYARLYIMYAERHLPYIWPLHEEICQNAVIRTTIPKSFCKLKHEVDVD